jgi:hypothetical protein
MKHSVLAPLALLLLAGSTSGCKKVDEPPVAPLAYSFQLLNEQGQASTVFAAGQTIVFRFQVENRSGQEMYLANPLFEGAHFLEVYQLGSGPPQSMGKPYQDLCLTYQAYYTVAAHSTLSFAVPWVKSAQYPDVAPFCTHAATAALPAGHYRTSFAPTLTWHLGTGAATTEPTPATATQEFEVK